MTKYHAVMIDECGQEFGVDLEANTHDDAYDQLRENYPESNIEQIESLQEARNREHATYTHIAEGDDWDD